MGFYFQAVTLMDIDGSGCKISLRGCAAVSVMAGKMMKARHSPEADMSGHLSVLAHRALLETPHHTYQSLTQGLHWIYIQHELPKNLTPHP